MEILKSNKGGSKLCFEDYMYTRHALRKTKQWWKCTMKSSRGCRDSLSTDLQHNYPVPGQPLTRGIICQPNQIPQQHERESSVSTQCSLLQKKTRQAYEELFQAVIDKCNNLGKAVVHHQSGRRFRRWSTTCNFNSSAWSSSWSPGLFLPFNAGYLAQNTETPTSYPLHYWSRISPVLQHTPDEPVETEDHM